MSWGKTLQGMLQAVEAAQAGGRVEYAARSAPEAFRRLLDLADGLDTCCMGRIGEHGYQLHVGSGLIDVVAMGGG